MIIDLQISHQVFVSVRVQHLLIGPWKYKKTKQTKENGTS